MGVVGVIKLNTVNIVCMMSKFRVILEHNTLIRGVTVNILQYLWEDDYSNCHMNFTGETARQGEVLQGHKSGVNIYSNF